MTLMLMMTDDEGEEDLEERGMMMKKIEAICQRKSPAAP